MPTRRSAAGSAVTTVIEEYIATIYLLAADGAPVIGARLARQLGVAPASVTEMVQRLVRDGLVRLLDSKAIELTDAGESLAESLVRRHRLAERWLTDELGLAWSDAQDEAARLRHALSPAVEQRLASALGNPETCPHGNPIPGEAGRGRGRGGVALTRADIGPALVVDRLAERAEREPAALRTLEAAGLVPGVRLYLREVDEVAGTVTIERAGQCHELPLAVAATVIVRDPEPPSPGREPTEPDPEPTYVVDVAAVDGWCRAHHQRGDRFEIGGCAPGGMCTEALVALHPQLARLRKRVDAGGKPIAEIPCPEDGTVTFRVELKRQDR